MDFNSLKNVEGKMIEQTLLLEIQNQISLKLSKDNVLHKIQQTSKESINKDTEKVVFTVKLINENNEVYTTIHISIEYYKKKFINYKYQINYNKS